MKLLMVSGDRTLASGKQGAFSQMLEEFSKHWERIDIVCPTPTLGPPPAHSTHAMNAEQAGSEQAGGGEKHIDERVFIHPSPHGLWYQPVWIRKKGAELIDAYGHDVMTVHEYPPFYNGIGARLLKRSTGIPAVLEIHHIVGWPKAASVNEWIGRLLSHVFLASHANHFEAVRTVNSTVQHQLLAWGTDARLMHVVPSFYLDGTMLRPDPAGRKNYDIVFCARLVDNKGLLPLLEALRALSGVSMLVIGDGRLRVKAEKTALDYGLQSRVTFAGWLPTVGDVVRAMQSGRLFVMPSLSEGGPRSALEAMACGVPVIATRVGVMSDVIQNGVNGLFTTGDAEDLAEKIRSLLASPEKQASMGKEAAKITERFEREKQIKAYADFLKDVVKEPLPMHANSMTI